MKNTTKAKDTKKIRGQSQGHKKKSEAKGQGSPSKDKHSRGHGQ